jgi:hypothetical protein
MDTPPRFWNAIVRLDLDRALVVVICGARVAARVVRLPGE